MQAATRPVQAFGGRWRTVSVGAVALVVGSFGLASCSVVNRVKKAEHSVSTDKATIDSFSSKLQSGAATTFEATYTTTGASPATVIYAVQPPTDLAFQDTPTGGGTSVHIIANSSGEYSCSPGASGSPASCQKLGTAGSTAENQIFDIYTPAHWVSFLKGLSVVAGLAGDKVSSSTMTVNGFPMQCVDLVAGGVAGTSTICSTAQGILGYVKVASNPTSFQIQSYSTTPSPSLFELPPGATVTTSPSTT
jgi:hypothetical protein